MKTHFPFWILLLAGPMMMEVSCAPRQTATVAAAMLPNRGNSTGTAVFNDVNAYRARLGKKPLVRHPGLDQLAQSHSEFLVRNRGKFKLSKTGNVSHVGFEARSAIARNRYRIPNLHENVAAGPRGTSMVSLWAASRAHEPNMRANWSYTGVGVAIGSDGTVFATQLFGTVPMSHRELRQKFGTW